MNITCDFLEKWLVGELPEETMDVLLKIRMKAGEHTFREDVYTHTLKYCRWNNQLRLFRSLKKRVANIFRKRNSLSNDSRGTSTQSIVNNMEREEERSVTSGDKRNSVHSDWSDLISVDEEAVYRKICKNKKGHNVASTAITSAASAAEAVIMPSTPPVKKTVKNIVLVLYIPSPNDWGSWQIWSPYATSTVVSPHAVHEQLNQEWKEEESGREEEEGELAYEPHSPYCSPVHPPEFYGDE